MAITTSPDNIPSPTSGDPYNYVVDMAAIADGTQDALTQKANMGVGTSTQRTAALGKFPDGALWYDTTTDSDWRKLGGAWVNQDTGWITLSGYGAWESARLAYRVIGTTCYLKGELWAGGGNGSTAISLPSAARPLVRCSAIVGRAGSPTGYTTAVNIVLETVGTVSVVEIVSTIPTTSPGIGLGTISYPVA